MKKNVWQNKIINKYIAINFIKVFLYMILAFSAIIFLITLMEKIKGSNIPIQILSLNIIYDLPMYFSTLLPFSILLSTMVVMWKLEKTSELTVIRGAGISAWQFIFPIILVATFLGILYTTTISPISTYFQKQNKELERTYKIASDDLNLVFTQHGLWLKESSDYVESFVYAEEIKQIENYLNVKNMTIFQINANGRFSKRIEASSGFIKDNIIEMSDVSIITPKEKIQEFETVAYPTSLSPKKITDNFALPESVSFWELPSMISFFNKNGFPAREYKMVYYKLLFLPIFLISMVMFGSIFTLSTNVRSAKNFAKIISGIGLGFFVYFIDQVFTAFGKTGTLPTGIAALSVPFIVIMISVFSLLMTEDG
ncbi:MAG: LptF/LptG family permease [Rickettsiales bacterium]|jgi:lipopolysaccharide export system permease protein|nr:LptF/LptG family permease [Rickettsiales bacterium]